MFNFKRIFSIMLTLLIMVSITTTSNAMPELSIGETKITDENFHYRLSNEFTISSHNGNIGIENNVEYPNESDSKRIQDKLNKFTDNSFVDMKKLANESGATITEEREDYTITKGDRSLSWSKINGSFYTTEINGMLSIYVGTYTGIADSDQEAAKMDGNQILANKWIIKSALGLETPTEHLNQIKILFKDFTPTPAFKGNVNIEVDGQAKDLSQQPFIENSRTYMPVRSVAEALDTDVTWNPTLRSVDIGNEYMYLQIVIGSKQAKRITVYEDGANVHEELIELETAPVIRNNRTYLPIRDIGENLYYHVGWRNSTRTVILETVMGS